MHRDGGQALDDEDLNFLKRYMQVNEVDFTAFRKACYPLYDKFPHKEILKHLLYVAK